MHIHRYLTLQRSGLVALDFTEEIDSSYGIDEEGLISEESHVNDPESSLIIPTRDYEHLCQQVKQERGEYANKDRPAVWHAQERSACA